MKCKLDILRLAITTRKGLLSNKCAWNKATDVNKLEYRNIIDVLLCDISIPDETVTSHDIDYKRSIDKICSDMINTCIQSGRTSIYDKREFSNVVPSWKN